MNWLLAQSNAKERNIAQTKKLEQEQWSEFLSVFSNGNRGRVIRIEVEDPANLKNEFRDMKKMILLK